MELWGRRGGVHPPVGQCQGVKNVELELVLCQRLSVSLNHVLSLHQQVDFFTFFLFLAFFFKELFFQLIIKCVYGLFPLKEVDVFKFS